MRLAVRFLDDVIEVSRYPVPELEGPARAARKVGLGVMGLAELLATLGIPYDSPAAVSLAGRIFRRHAGRGPARLRGSGRRARPVPAVRAEQLRPAGDGPLRNAQLTSVAPTGTISLIAGTTSGIEPMFALAYVRHILGRRACRGEPAVRAARAGPGLFLR